MYCLTRGRLWCRIAAGLVPLMLMSNGQAAMDVTLNVFNQDVRLVSVSVQGQILNDGVVEVMDNHPDLVGLNIDELGDNRNIDFLRRTSLFVVTLTGERYGRTVNLRGKLGKSQFKHNANGKSIGGFNDYEGYNHGCATVRPQTASDGHQYAYGSGRWVQIDSGNHDFIADCVGRTLSVIYSNSGTIGTFDDARQVFLDLPGMMQTELWKSLPPDVYSAVYRGNLEALEDRQRGVYRDLGLTLAVTLRKQPYFSALLLPSSQLDFTVNYTPDRVNGYAATPFFLQGAFDPYFGRVRLSASSDNNFALRSDDGQLLPYHAELHIGGGGRIFALNQATSAAPIEIESLSNANQIPLGLTFHFDQPKSGLNNGRYSDRVTLIAEVPLIP